MREIYSCVTITDKQLIEIIGYYAAKCYKDVHLIIKNYPRTHPDDKDRILVHVSENVFLYPFETGASMHISNSHLLLLIPVKHWVWIRKEKHQ